MKHEIALKQSSVETWKDQDFHPTTLEIVPPSPTLDDGGRVNYFHRLSMESGKVSIAAALMTALVLMKKKVELPGAYCEWIDANTNISRMTAGRYMAVLEKSFPREQILALVQDSSQTQIEVVSKFTARTNYQSLYQVYHSEGIVKKSNLGGGGRGQGRKPKAQTEQTATDALAAIARDPDLAKAEADGVVSALYQFAVLRDGFGFLTESALAEVLQTLRDILAKGDEIARSRKAK